MMGLSFFFDRSAQQLCGTFCSEKLREALRSKSGEAFALRSKQNGPVGLDQSRWNAEGWTKGAFTSRLLTRAGY